MAEMKQQQRILTRLKNILIALIGFLWLVNFQGESIVAGDSKRVNDPSKLRIISNVPSATEICYALELERYLVGVTDFCTYPPAARTLNKIGGIMNPDLERILALRPDFIIVQDTQTDLIAKYKELGLEILIIKADSIEDVYAAVQSIGAKAGAEKKATALVQSIQAEVRAVQEAARKLKKVKAVVVIGHEPGSLREIYAAGRKSFYHRLLEMAGGANCIMDENLAYPKISKEELLKQSPESIIVLRPENELSATDRALEVELWKALSFIAAVKNERISVMNGEFLFIPGPRMVLIARDFFRCLHPEAPLAPALDESEAGLKAMNDGIQ